MNGEPKHKIFFADYELDAARRRLTRGGEEVRLNPKAFDVLVYLTENAGRVLTKDEILSAVWDSQFVEEANLAVQISALRKALNAKKDAPGFLLTVPGKGYQFVADVQTDEEIIIENHKFSRLVIDEGKLSENEEKNLENQKNSAFSLYRFAFSRSGLVLVLLLTITAAIWFWRGSGGKSSEIKQPKISRLTTSGKVSAVTLSPDGRFAVFSRKEPNGESLWLRQIETGSQTRIAPPQPLEYLGLAIPPDGDFVYASVYLENQADTPLWKIPILGGAPQEIPGVVTAAAVSFAPDGGRLVYVESHRPETHLLIADADGANERILIRAHNDRRRFPFEQANPAAWSPDGGTIAAAFEEKSADGLRAGILLVNPADGNERVLVAPQWAFVDSVAWLDSENLIFTGYDDEWLNQIWTVSAKTGEARQMTNNIQKYQWLAAVDGKLLTAQVSAVSNIYTADFKEDAETLEPREILRESGYISWLDWGENGEIFYISRATGRLEIWRVENDGANASPVTSGANSIYGLAVSPVDGSLVFPSHRGGKYTLWTADENGKNMRPLSDGAEQIYPDMAADGKIVFQNGDYRIERLSPPEQMPFYLTKGIKPAISPDGRQTAFFLMDEGKWRVQIVATDSGAFLTMLDLPATVKQRRMRWHPSGKLITIIYNAGENLNLLLLPTDGGAVRIVENLGKGVINSFNWSADGKQILYSVTTETKDAVLLSDF